jgi:hypothetical protein
VDTPCDDCGKYPCECVEKANQTINLSMDKFTITDTGKGVFDALSLEPITLNKNISGNKAEIDITKLNVTACFIGNIPITPEDGIITLYAAQLNAAPYTLSIHFTHNGKNWQGSLAITVTNN